MALNSGVQIVLALSRSCRYLPGFGRRLQSAAPSEPLCVSHPAFQYVRLQLHDRFPLTKQRHARQPQTLLCSVASACLMDAHFETSRHALERTDDAEKIRTRDAVANRSPDQCGPIPWLRIVDKDTPGAMSARIFISLGKK